jgi:hypothetical protein
VHISEEYAPNKNAEKVNCKLRESILEKFTQTVRALATRKLGANSDYIFI